MKVLSQMRIAIVDFIYAMSNQSILAKQDIRYVKPSSGAVIRKIVTTIADNGKEQTVETPYQASDNYITYDLTISDTTAVEQIGDKVTSMLTLHLQVVVIGKDADQQIQTMLAKMSSVEYDIWRASYQYSILQLPENIEPDDVFHNQEWWIRRKFDMYFTTSQEIALTPAKQVTGITHAAKII